MGRKSNASKAAEVNADDFVEVERDPSLITVTKDGEELDVHETCVKSHQAAGWKVKA